MPKKLSYSVGDKFWMMTVVKILDSVPGKRRRVICKCECGGSKEVLIDNLKYGSVRSCGCMTNVSHRHCLKGVMSPTYRSWQNMISRCHNPAATAYHHYGGSGILVCDRWRFGENGLSPFQCFLDDMGVRPSLDLTIERISNAKGYAPGNVKWATKKAQARNRSTTIFYEFNGQRLTLGEIAELVDMPLERLRGRICKRGWSLDAAVSAPPWAKKPRD